MDKIPKKELVYKLSPQFIFGPLSNIVAIAISIAAYLSTIAPSELAKDQLNESCYLFISNYERDLIDRKTLKEVLYLKLRTEEKLQYCRESKFFPIFKENLVSAQKTLADMQNREEVMKDKALSLAYSQISNLITNSLILGFIDPDIQKIPEVAKYLEGMNISIDFDPNNASERTHDAQSLANNHAVEQKSNAKVK